MEACLAGLAARGFTPTAVLDVGAARGLWTRSALRHWPEAEYYLIEPILEQTAAMDERLRARPNLHVINVAAGAKEGTARIGFDPHCPDGSSLAYESGTAREVRVTTLDRLLRSGAVSQPQLLKIDVQGYELEVLSGAERCVSSSELALVEVELHRFAPLMPLMQEVVAWMAARGFRVYEIADVLRRPRDGAMGQCDLLFCAEGHSLLSSSVW